MGLSRLWHASPVPPQDKALEEALQLAGKNRTELESVLTHYQNSPLKLEAATLLSGEILP